MRSLHEIGGRKSFAGRCAIVRGEGWLAAVLLWIARLPRAGDDLPVTVVIEADAKGETWTRDFAGSRMQTRLTARDGVLNETLGPVRLRFELSADEEAIRWRAVGASVLGVPVPAAWLAGMSAREGEESGRYTFDVRAEAPLVGLLIHYRGWLAIDE